MQVVQSTREGRKAAGIGCPGPMTLGYTSIMMLTHLQVKIQKHLLWILNKPGFGISSGFRAGLQPWGFRSRFPQASVSPMAWCVLTSVCHRVLNSPEYHSLSGISNVRDSAFYSYNLSLKTSFGKERHWKMDPRQLLRPTFITYSFVFHYNILSTASVTLLNKKSSPLRQRSFIKEGMEPPACFVPCQG